MAKVIRLKSDILLFSSQCLKQGKKIGFVPTMGCLHEGHLSLMRASKKENDITVVSIFVNPTQFGPHEDFKKYPRDFDRDLKLLNQEKVDAIFYPSTQEIYGQRTQERTSIRIPESLIQCLCGKYRPGHFEGVAQIVSILFHLVSPQRAYFGQKDYQQTVIVRRLVADRHFPIAIRVMPTIREKDGLAMSSRNIFLTKKQRKSAPLLYQALLFGKKCYKDGERNSRIIERKVKDLINQNKNIRLQYVQIRDAETLQKIKRINRKAVLAVAAYGGKTRLIDNILLC